MATTTTCDKCHLVITGWPLSLIIDEKPRPNMIPGLNSTVLAQQQRQDRVRRIEDLCERCAADILAPFPTGKVAR